MLSVDEGMPCGAQLVVSFQLVELLPVQVKVVEKPGVERRRRRRKSVSLGVSVSLGLSLSVGVGLSEQKRGDVSS
jgi:hypothetical protein